MKQGQLTAIAVMIVAIGGFIVIRAGQRKSAVKIETPKETE